MSKKTMEHCEAVAEYDREGNLYIGEVTMESFHRQGLEQWPVGRRLLVIL